MKDLGQLKELVPLARDAQFRQAWRLIKQNNKQRLARYILRKIKTGVDPATLFDVQVKRIHEYKRQLLNVLHVITCYNRIKSDPAAEVVPRTVIFAGKAAPAYQQAKLIIKLINAVGETVNRDEDMNGKLRVVFLPNYCVSQAEKIMPAADLSEQISTAGMEASGTGNMKLSLNGAVTIGTLDGANVEILEEVGAENIFIFGLTSEEVLERRKAGYDPGYYYDSNAELRQALDMIGTGFFSPRNASLFAPILNGLLSQGDYYMVLADFSAYIETQASVSRLYSDPEAWAACSICNTAKMGKFSSDRAIMEYARDIWQVHPISL
ncbi:MAG: glycogen/starch/alpha-glucan phosphorylase [Desulfosarcinaceae bacterium]